jgi:hypothetical protein
VVVDLVRWSPDSTTESFAPIKRALYQPRTSNFTYTWEIWL